MTDEEIQIAASESTPRFKLVRWIRNRFFTGVIIALPVIATVMGVSWIVQKIDNNVLKFIPGPWNPKTYLGFDIPGLGLIISIILLFLLGVIASNFIGNSVIKAGERLLARVPVVSPVYNALKQIVTTVAQQKDRAFRDVCLLEYPRKGLYAIGFVTADLSGAPADMTPEEGAKMIISGGMVSSNEALAADDPEMEKLLRKQGRLKITPPS